MDAIKSIESSLNNKYDILNIIATGGMGAIYLSVDLKLQRKVAIKIIHKQYISDPEYRARFIREAQTVAKFDHPNIIKIYDFGSADEFDYFVMPYVEGLTYKECLVEAEGVDLKKNVAILIDVARALEYAHSKEIIHRDLKPANFMIKSDDNRVLLMDFGTSKDLVDQDITLPDTMLGTPKYMSPEQVRLGGKEADTETGSSPKVHFKSDLYALGIILYEALTGKYPFSATTMISLCMCHLNEVPEPPNRVNPEIPEALNELIMSLISKKPEDRTSSAGEVVQHLEVILRALEMPDLVGTESTSTGSGAPPSGSMTRGEKRFSWIHAGLSAAIISVVMAVGGYFFWPSTHGINEITQAHEKIIEDGEVASNLPLKKSDEEARNTAQLPKEPVTTGTTKIETSPFPVDTDKGPQDEYAIVDTPVHKTVKADPGAVVLPESELPQEAVGGAHYEKEDVIQKQSVDEHIDGLKIITPPAVTLTTSQRGYDIGEKLSITIKVIRPCFLTVLYQDVYGDLTQVYPNIYAQSQKISKLSDILIPDASWGIDLELAGPKGEETVIALSGDSALDIWKEDYSKQPFYALSHGEKKRVAGVMANFKKRKPAKIDVQKVSFHIY